jgi:hypothetical protein
MSDVMPEVPRFLTVSKGKETRTSPYNEISFRHTVAIEDYGDEFGVEETTLSDYVTALTHFHNTVLRQVREIYGQRLLNQSFLVSKEVEPSHCIIYWRFTFFVVELPAEKKVRLEKEEKSRIRKAEKMEQTLNRKKERLLNEISEFPDLIKIVKETL